MIHVSIIDYTLHISHVCWSLNLFQNLFFFCFCLFSLANMVHQLGPLEENVLAHITYQIVFALAYLRRHLKRVHRDIKPSNVLINSQGKKIKKSKNHRIIYRKHVTYLSILTTITYLSFCVKILKYIRELFFVCLKIELLFVVCCLLFFVLCIVLFCSLQD